MVAILSLMKQRYRIYPPRRIYEVYVEQLERARIFEVRATFRSSYGYQLAAIQLKV
jgi:hypothetical protein